MVLDAKRSVKAKFPNKMVTRIVGIVYPTFLLTVYPRLSVVTLSQRWGCRQPTESPGESLLLPEQRTSLFDTCGQPDPEVQAELKSRDGLRKAICTVASEETKVKRLRICYISVLLHHRLPLGILLIADLLKVLWMPDQPTQFCWELGALHPHRSGAWSV